MNFQLTIEQKLKMLLVQRDVMNARLVLNDAQHKYENALNATNAAATDIVRELGIDGSKHTFDMDNLVIIPNE